MTLSIMAIAPEPIQAVDLFPKLGGWQRDLEIQTYTPENLFEAINGAADLFLAYGFKELQAAEYRDRRKASVFVEIYAHGNPLQAFGIYSQERSPRAQYFAAGAQAYLDGDAGFAGLLKGSHYVRIFGQNLGPEKDEILREFVLKTAEILPGEAKLPELLGVFPNEGKLENSELYIDRNVLGYAFLKAGFTAEYEVKGHKFRLFILDGQDRAGARAMVSEYLAGLGQKLKDVPSGTLKLNDPNHGLLELSRRGRYVAGVLNLTDQELRGRLLHALLDKLAETGH